MGLREGQKQQREEGNLIDAETSVWMGLREGDTAEVSRCPDVQKRQAVTK